MDITVSELAIGSFFPADPHTAAALHAAGPKAPGPEATGEAGDAEGARRVERGGGVGGR